MGCRVWFRVRVHPGSSQILPVSFRVCFRVRVHPRQGMRKGSSHVPWPVLSQPSGQFQISWNFSLVCQLLFKVRHKDSLAEKLRQGWARMPSSLQYTNRKMLEGLPEEQLQTLAGHLLRSSWGGRRASGRCSTRDIFLPLTQCHSQSHL